jgi:hypothetical protein
MLSSIPLVLYELQNIPPLRMPYRFFERFFNGAAFRCPRFKFDAAISEFKLEMSNSMILIS